MTKKVTRLQKVSTILENAKTTKWCYVNTENEFKFNGNTYVIHQSVKEYIVHNKAGTVEDYTNEAYMEDIFVVVDNENKLKFYNQNYELVESKNVKVIEQ